MNSSVVLSSNITYPSGNFKISLGSKEFVGFSLEHREEYAMDSLKIECGSENITEDFILVVESGSGYLLNDRRVNLEELEDYLVGGKFENTLASTYSFVPVGVLHFLYIGSRCLEDLGGMVCVSFNEMVVL